MVKVVLQITFFLCVCQNLDVVGIKETYLAAGAYIQKKYAKKASRIVFPPQIGLVVALATSKQNQKGCASSGAFSEIIRGLTSQ